MSKHVFVGVSGFSYASWKGRFYPKEAKSEDFLSNYSKLLNSVEINSSFYAAPTLAIIKSWSDKAGDDFRFAFKAPRQITHILKLKDGASESADRLSQNLNSLGQKRGPILFQLPPYLKQDLGLLENFLHKTSEIPDRVFEFRHKSWLDDSTYNLLERYKTGFCVAETEDLDPVFKVTGDFAYFRLRKDAYDAKAISNWSSKIRELVRDSGSAYAFLRHDETGENAGLALTLSELLSAT